MADVNCEHETSTDWDAWTTANLRLSTRLRVPGTASPRRVTCFAHGPGRSAASAATGTSARRSPDSTLGSPTDSPCGSTPHPRSARSGPYTSVAADEGGTVERRRLQRGPAVRPASPAVILPPSSSRRRGSALGGLAIVFEAGQLAHAERTAGERSAAASSRRRLSHRLRRRARPAASDQTIRVDVARAGDRRTSSCCRVALRRQRVGLRQRHAIRHPRLRHL